VSTPAAAWGRTWRQALAIGAPLGGICLLVGVAAPSFVQMCFGDAFADAVLPLRWLLPGAFFAGVTSVLSQYAAASGFPKSVAIVWVSGLALAVAASMVLVPLFAAAGAAIALSATQAVIFVLILGICLRLERGRCREAALEYARV
jgi:O-antigen/teichoic acid export membrane protein